MGGLTGGLLGKMMPAAGADITDAAGEITQAAVPQTNTLADLAKATGPSTQALQAGQLGWEGGSAAQGFFDKLGSNLGFTQGASPDMLTGANPTGLTQTQAMMGQALPAAASGLVGEMYVPYDMEMPEDDDPYPYEGPYMPTEQRTMMGGFDPMGSAFTGEQDMIGGNVLPDAPNFAGGGMIENLSGLGMAKNMIEDGNFGILPMLYNQFKDKDEDEQDIVGTPQQQMAYGGLIRMANGGSPAQKQIQESAETLARREQDRLISEQLQGLMSAPMRDPRPAQPMPLPNDMSVEAAPLPMPNEALTRERTPMARTLNDVMTPQPYQAPSLEKIQRLQTQTLDDLYGPNPDSFLEQEFPKYAKAKEINRKYNPILRGIEHGLPLLTKGGMEVYEAIDEFRNK